MWNFSTLWMTSQIGRGWRWMTFICPRWLRERAPGQFSLMVYSSLSGFGHVMMGVLRAMADDYGALAMPTHNGQQEGVELISIALVESYFAEGR